MNGKIVNSVLIPFLFILIAGCANTVYAPASDNSRYFTRPFFVCEQVIWGSKSIVLFRIREFPQKLPRPLPTLSEYLQNREAWLQWHRVFAGNEKYRILGTVDQNDLYRVDRTEIRSFSGLQENYITIMTGPFSGTHVEYLFGSL